LAGFNTRFGTKVNFLLIWKWLIFWTTLYIYDNYFSVSIVCTYDSRIDSHFTGLND